MVHHLERVRARQICLIAVLLGFHLLAVPVRADETAATLAVVNETRITESDLEFFYLSRDVRVDLRPGLRARYIELLIDRSLLKEFLRSRKIQAPESIVQQRVARAEKLITHEGLDFNQSLKQLGYTRESFREEVALPLAWLEHARLVITDKAIAEYWASHRAEFDGTEVKAAHIVKRLPKPTTEKASSTAARELTTIRDSILAGTTTFANAAREHSDSPSGKEGGNLGQFTFRGRMPQDLTSVAFKLKSDDISQPFETPFGVHILTVTEIVPGDLSLEDARGEIFRELSARLQDVLIEDLRTKATISRTEN